MAIVISIHQVADKSVTWKQAAQATQFGAIWLQLIGQEVWQKLSYLFDQLPRLHKSLGNPTDLVCSRNDYILWYKFQKFKKCKKVLGYALIGLGLPTQIDGGQISWLLPSELPFLIFFWVFLAWMPWNISTSNAWKPGSHCGQKKS